MRAEGFSLVSVPSLLALRVPSLRETCYAGWPMEKRCVALTTNGSQCRFTAQPRSNFCGHHRSGNPGPLGGHVYRTMKKAAKKAAKKTAKKK
jgi:hypothetical protein